MSNFKYVTVEKFVNDEINRSSDRFQVPIKLKYAL